MKLKHKFFLYIFVLHIIILGLSFGYFEEQKYLFIIVEITVVLSLYLSYHIYKHYIHPFNLISLTIKTINDNQFDLNYLKDKNPEINQMIKVFNQMLNQLRHERRMQKEQHFFLEKLIEAMPIGVLTLDGNNKIKNLNHTGERLLKSSKELLLQKRVEEIQEPIFKEINHLQDDKPKIINTNGLERYRLLKSHFINNGFHNHFILIEELTSEVLQTEKKAYGKIIRMMSHEVNNSVGAINSLVKSLAYYQGDIRQEHQDDFKNALEVIFERNENMNQFMNNFAKILRVPSPIKKPIHLGEFLLEIKVLMQASLLNKNIQIEIIKPDLNYQVDLDKKQVEQLLVNVIKNAAESIKNNGLIKLILKPESNQLCISDTGSGINTDISDKIYTPFYSTKESGQGIGLTLCREIAINHGFTFELKNNKEKGATFVLNFNS